MMMMIIIIINFQCRCITITDLMYPSQHARRVKFTYTLYAGMESKQTRNSTTVYRCVWSEWTNERQRRCCTQWRWWSMLLRAHFVFLQIGLATCSNLNSLSVLATVTTLDGVWLISFVRSCGIKTLIQLAKTAHRNLSFSITWPL